ncbi:hypothetical protein B0J14DRAFT_640420 [Halenospora varia]|nr:hypothetical protein B0J14DRAFT_640420 [Halenospora varia]
MTRGGYSCHTCKSELGAQTLSHFPLSCKIESLSFSITLSDQVSWFDSSNKWKRTVRLIQRFLDPSDSLSSYVRDLIIDEWPGDEDGDESDEFNLLVLERVIKMRASFGVSAVLILRFTYRWNSSKAIPSNIPAIIHSRYPSTLLYLSTNKRSSHRIDLNFLRSTPLYSLDYTILTTYNRSSESSILTQVLRNSANIRFLRLDIQNKGSYNPQDHKYFYTSHGLNIDASGPIQLRIGEGDTLPPLEGLGILSNYYQFLSLSCLYQLSRNAEQTCSNVQFIGSFLASITAVEELYIKSEEEALFETLWPCIRASGSTMRIMEIHTFPIQQVPVWKGEYLQQLQNEFPRRETLSIDIGSNENLPALLSASMGLRRLKVCIKIPLEYRQWSEEGRLRDLELRVQRYEYAMFNENTLDLNIVRVKLASRGGEEELRTEVDRKRLVVDWLAFYKLFDFIPSHRPVSKLLCAHQTAYTPITKRAPLFKAFTNSFKFIIAAAFNLSPNTLLSLAFGKNKILHLDAEEVTQRPPAFHDIIHLETFFRDTPTFLHLDAPAGSVAKRTSIHQGFFVMERTQLTHPDIDPTARFTAPFYTPSPRQAYRLLPTIRPATLFAHGISSPNSWSAMRKRRIELCGSQWLGFSTLSSKARVKEVTLKGGHFAIQ